MIGVFVSRVSVIGVFMSRVSVIGLCVLCYRAVTCRACGSVIDVFVWRECVIGLFVLQSGRMPCVRVCDWCICVA